MGKFRKYLGLAWPLLALIASHVSLILLVTLVKGDEPLWVSLLILVAFLCWVLFAIWTVVSVFRALGMVRRHFGIYTRSEKRDFEKDRLFAEGYARGQDLLAHMAAGGQPLVYSTWDFVLNSDELLHIDTVMHYSRYYGTEVSYMHTSTVAAGRASFVVGAAIGNAIGNASARKAAMEAAQPMWRNHQHVKTLVTDQRVLCRTDHGWLSFHYGAITVCHADPSASSVILEFNSTETLRLHGPDAPSFCVLILAALHGHSALINHPGLNPLRIR